VCVWRGLSIGDNQILLHSTFQIQIQIQFLCTGPFKEAAFQGVVHVDVDVDSCLMDRHHVDEEGWFEETERERVSPKSATNGGGSSVKHSVGSLAAAFQSLTSRLQGGGGRVGVATRESRDKTRGKGVGGAGKVSPKKKGTSPTHSLPVSVMAADADVEEEKCGGLTSAYSSLGSLLLRRNTTGTVGGAAGGLTTTMGRTVSNRSSITPASSSAHIVEGTIISCAATAAHQPTKQRAAADPEATPLLMYSQDECMDGVGHGRLPDDVVDAPGFTLSSGGASSSGFWMLPKRRSSSSACGNDSHSHELQHIISCPDDIVENSGTSNH
jgi:hypothetical protein